MMGRWIMSCMEDEEYSEEDEVVSPQ